MQFKDIAVGQSFKFEWSGYVGVKTSARGYTYNATEALTGKPRAFFATVGTVKVAVIPLDKCERCGDNKPVGQSCGCFDNHCQ